MRAKHIVFVHGLFGWGHGAVADLPYWGEAIPALRDQLDKKVRRDNNHSRGELWSCQLIS